MSVWTIALGVMLGKFLYNIVDNTLTVINNILNRLVEKG